ncbi:UNVERIFIED_CONTAM: hypothetical protein GTU68_020895 [Idotea baltica]|nr:hypothetical protein [Idotea baltica]
MKDPVIFRKIIDLFAERIKNIDFDYIVGLESRGFLFGTALSIVINKGFIMLRKKNKLPGEVFKYTYDLEYG